MNARAPVPAQVRHPGRHKQKDICVGTKQTPVPAQKRHPRRPKNESKIPKRIQTQEPKPAMHGRTRRQKHAWATRAKYGSKTFFWNALHRYTATPLHRGEKRHHRQAPPQRSAKNTPTDVLDKEG